MPQARILVNGLVGSNTDLPISTTVGLDNQNVGGETTFNWAILDQPPGAADALTAPTSQNPSIAPKKEGTYLLRLIVNQGLPNEQTDRIVLAVRQVKTRERIPAAGETTEADGVGGWSVAANSYLRRMDKILSDPGTIIGVNASGSALPRGTVLRCTAASIIKAGLPGQETVPGFTIATAQTQPEVDELLVILEGGVDGSTTPAAGALVQVRYIGRFGGVTTGTGVVGASVFLSDSGNLNTVQGTIRRNLGSCMSSGNPYDVWFNGVGGAEVAPNDVKYLVYGSPGQLSNAARTDGANATPTSIGGNAITFVAGDNSTMAAAARRFSSASTAPIFGFQDENFSNLFEVTAAGVLRWPSIQGTIRTTGAQPIVLSTNAVDKWQVTSGGTLQAMGTTRFIGNVANPVLDNDAENLTDVLWRIRSNLPQNIVSNSMVEYSQRWGVVFGKTGPFSTARLFSVDRWYHWAPSKTAADYNVSQVLEFDNLYWLRTQRQVGATNTSTMYCVQEIDRDQLKRHVQSNVQTRLQFRVRFGSGFTGTLRARLYTGTGSDGQTFYNSSGSSSGYTSSTVALDYLVTNGTADIISVRTAVALSASITTMAVVFEWTPTSTAAPSTEYYEVSDIQVVADHLSLAASTTTASMTYGSIPTTGIANSYFLPPYNYLARTKVGEGTQMQRFFEKSYGLNTAVGDNPNYINAFGFFVPSAAGNMTTTRFPVPYKVVKRVLPTVTLYNPQTGATGSLSDGVNNPAYGTIEANESGFTVASGPASTGLNTWLRGHWTSDAEI